MSYVIEWKHYQPNTTLQFQPHKNKKIYKTTSNINIYVF